MNYTFSLSHDDFVVETKWLGEIQWGSDQANY